MLTAVRQGFAFRGLVSNQETKELIGNPEIWHPVKSAIVGARWGRRVLQRQYALLAELARDKDTVLVAYPPVFVARLVGVRQVDDDGDAELLGFYEKVSVIYVFSFYRNTK